MQKKILITFLFKEGAGPIVHAMLSSKIANRRDWEDDNSFKTVTFINTGTRETAIKTTLVFFLKEKKVLKNQFKHIHFDYAISTFYHPWASTVLRCFDVRKKIIICIDPKFYSDCRKKIWL